MHHKYCPSLIAINRALVPLWKLQGGNKSCVKEPKKVSTSEFVSVDILGFEFRVITAQKKLASQKSTGDFVFLWDIALQQVITLFPLSKVSNSGDWSLWLKLEY